MINEIKNVLLLEIKEAVTEYEEKAKEVEKLRAKIKELEYQYEDLSSEYENLSRVYGKNTPTVAFASVKNKKFSFFDRVLFKRKEYSNWQKLVEIGEKMIRINTEIVDLEYELEGEEKDLKQKNISRERFEQIKNAKTLKDLGISFKEAQEILKKNNIPLVLRQEDKEITSNEAEFDEWSDFILVHKTEYSPKGSRVLSQKATGKKKQKTIIMENGESFSYEFPLERDTVHFCLNGEVLSHEYGNFDHRRYIVLMPYDEVKSEDRRNLGAFNEEDTFYTGGLDIEGGYILCPETEVERIQEMNPNVMVVGYVGEDADGFGNAFLSTLGYKREEITKNEGWQSQDSIKVTGGANKRSNHEQSEENRRDYTVRKFEEYFGFYEALKKYKQSGKKFDIDMLNDVLVGVNEYTIIYRTSDGSVEKECTTKNNNFTIVPVLLEPRPEINEKVLKYFDDDDDGTHNYYKYKADNTNQLQKVRQYLVHLLEDKYNIEISENVKNIILIEDNKIPNTSEEFSKLIDEIEDEKAKEYLKKVLEKQNGKIENPELFYDMIASSLIIRTMYDEVYKEEKNREEQMDEEFEPEE